MGHWPSLLHVTDALPANGVAAVSRQGSPGMGSVPWALGCGAGLSMLRVVVADRFHP